MAAFLFFLFLFAFFSATISAQKSALNISLGSSLTPTGTSSWLSQSGLFAFGFYQLGNGYAVGVFLAGIPQKTVVWTANRDNAIFSGDVSLALSSDGRLILQQTQDQDINIFARESISWASMLDSGNFVLYDSDGRIIWQTFDHPTNTLLPGQRLSADQELVSSASKTDDSKGTFKIVMQSDGNLVQYPLDTPDTGAYAYYASGTHGSGNNTTLQLEDDGYLYLINSSVGILSNLTKGGYPRDRNIYLLKIDVDGIVRLYSIPLNQDGQSILWESTNDKCAPLGLCGLNAYCTKMDNVAECRCLPGFDFVNQGKWSSGCERNFTTESCKSTTVSVTYNIRSLESTLWENNPFSVIETNTKEDCENVCLEDCNCEAAFFKDGQCRKQKLPLRFGRRAPDSNIALIKVGTVSSVSSQGNSGNLPKTVKKEVRLDILIIGISLAGFGVLIAVIAAVYVHINRGKVHKEILQKRNDGFLEDMAPSAFTFEELEQATNGFTEELGRGAFGPVYKGFMQNLQKRVAVKKLEKVLTGGENQEFLNEITVIGKTHHRNLVRLLGYCLDGTKRFLVNEYMSNGSLADVLFKKGNHLRWDERIRIACDVARGILFLHEECEKQIIHCDIKPQNILLDENRIAKISDFGLAKLLEHDKARTYAAIRGTRGYVAPEWHRKSALTVKADVYCFGIVLLEIVCCRKSVDWSFPEDEAVLQEWAYDCFDAGELHKLVADEEVDMRKLERMIKTALWCIQNEPSLRPSMKKVLSMLEGTIDIPRPPGPDTFLSAM